MNKRIAMQALAGVFALGVGTALAAPETTTRPADPTQPARPSAGTAAPTPTPVPPPPAPTGTTRGTTGTTGTIGTPPPPPTTATAPAGATLTASEQKQAKRVLTDIHNVNALEITLGRMAQQKAESQAIKDYAQMLVTDHEAADKKVMDFASANNIMLTGAIGTTGAATATDTSTRTGMGPGATGAQGATGTGATTTAGTNPTTATTGTGNSPATATPPTTDTPPLDLSPADRRTVAKLEKLEGTKFEKAFLTEMVRGHQKTLNKLKAAEKSAKNVELKTLLGDISSSVQMHLDKAKELQKAGST